MHEIESIINFGIPFRRKGFANLPKSSPRKPMNFSAPRIGADPKRRTGYYLFPQRLSAPTERIVPDGVGLVVQFGAFA